MEASPQHPAESEGVCVEAASAERRRGGCGGRGADMENATAEGEGLLEVGGLMEQKEPPAAIKKKD
jgi:hypothetical protein